MIKIIKNYTKIFRGMRLPWLLLFLLVVISAIQANVEVGAITLTASIIDGTQKAIKTDELIQYIELQLLSGIITIASTYISGLVLQKLNLLVRLRVWNKMMNLPTSYYDSDNANELVTRVTSDADSAGNYFQLIISMFIAVYSAIVAYRQLFHFQLQMGMALLLIIPLTIGISVFYSVVAYRAGSKTRMTLAASMGYLAEHVRGLRLIKSFRMEDEEYRQADDLFRKQCRSDIALSYTNMIQMGGMELIGCMCIVISFVLGGRLVASGDLTIGRLIAFYTLPAWRQPGWRRSARLWEAFPRMRASCRRSAPFWTRRRNPRRELRWMWPTRISTWIM